LASAGPFPQSTYGEQWNVEVRDRRVGDTKGDGLTWKLRNQILLSRSEKVRIWSIKGFAFRAVDGTPKI
jgi:hypothetical protein